MTGGAPLHAARRRFLAFTEECDPGSIWLHAWGQAFASEPLALLNERTLNGLRDNPYSSASFYLNLLRYPLRAGHAVRPWRQAASMEVSQRAAVGGFL